MFMSLNTRYIRTAIALLAAVAFTVAGARAVQVNVDHIYDRQTTGDNDHKKCKTQPCSPDGVWQATGLALKIGPVAKGYHLTNVTLTHSQNDPFPQFCTNPPAMDVEVRVAQASLKCWSAAVTWTLEGDVVKDVGAPQSIRKR